MDYLKEIEINFPNSDKKFFDALLEFLDIISVIPQSPVGLFPTVSIKQLEKKDLTVGFSTTNECLTIEVKNNTGQEWANKYLYKHISLDKVQERLQGKRITSFDHLGINLPWKEQVHPLIDELSNNLKDKCLYHLFPSGEPWDFIIPGTLGEITNNNINYNLDRKPKFEIVSFDGCSTPLVQIDGSIDVSYNDLKKLFPEAIHLDDIKSIWIYLEVNYDFDVCLVLNQRGNGWTDYFSGHRL